MPKYMTNTNLPSLLFITPILLALGMLHHYPLISLALLISKQ